MALIRGNFYSRELKQQTHFQAYLPVGSETDYQREWKVLILLHGLMGNCDSWFTNSLVVQYAEKNQTLLFCPEGHRSFYSNLSNGNYLDYIGKELPKVISEMFGISANRERWGIAGYSMGGHGALKVSILNSEIFGYCGNFSSLIYPMKHEEMIDSGMFFLQEPSYLASHFEKTPELMDMKNLLLQNQSKRLPKFISYCGKLDFLYQQNYEFNQLLETHNIDHIYESWEGGHDWAFWNASIEKFFKEFF